VPRVQRFCRLAFVLAVIQGAALCAAQGAAAERPLALGFSGVTDLSRVTAVGGTTVRLGAGWPAAMRPKEPTDPADPAYNFTGDDEALRAAHSHGLRVVLEFTYAPRWAEGPNRPRSAKPGSWMPNPAAVGAYAAALSRRYSGRYPDPLRPGRTLPRIAALQVWNEPNLASYLTPQWRRVGGHYSIFSPSWYRRMLNAAYLAVKRVNRTMPVAAGGTAPYGDLSPDQPSGAGQRIQPARFFREMLSKRVRFDAWDHHPYPIGDPFQHALNRDDAAINDLGKLSRPLRAAQRAGRVLPRGGHQRLWITEVSYDTNPPDRDGVPIRTQARWLSQTLYLLWRQGASLVTWFRETDENPGNPPAYNGTSQSGVFFLDGAEKPSAQAFRFPMTALSRGSRRTLVWARAPAAGRLVFEKRSGSSWRTVSSATVRRGQVVQRVIALHGARGLRARVGTATSLIT